MTKPFSAEWIFDLLNQRRIELGLTQTEVTKRALGFDNADVFQKLRRGSVPSATRLKAACDALGLEFYVGPPREGSETIPPKITGALELPEDAAVDDVIEAIKARRHLEADSAQTDWQEAAAALNRALVRAAEAADTVARWPVTDLTDDSALARQLAPGAAIEFPTGRPVAVRELQSAAGGGVMDLDETETGHVYFRTQWLKKHGLNPDRCCVIGVTGESMEPTLVDGCSILLDHDRRQLRAGGIFVVRTGDGLVVKRAGRDRDGSWQLCSDNPDWMPVPWSDDADIVGQVMWTARTLI